MSTYFAILTAVGEAKIANANALGIPLKLTQMAVGDGNGATPIPSRTQTALVRQVRRAPLNQLSVDPQNPNQVIAEQVLPETDGGWWIREIGIYDDAGDLCAVANCPPSYKPQLSEGSGRTQVVRMVLVVSSASAVELKIDPSVVLATRKYADDQDAARMAQHLAAGDPHPQYLNVAEGNAMIEAAVAALVNSSPAALDTLSELANAINNDANFAATINNAIATKAPNSRIGNRQGSTIISNAALTAADAGKFVLVSGTVYLPFLEDCQDGTEFLFFNTTGVPVTIHCQGNDKVTPDGSLQVAVTIEVAGTMQVTKKVGAPFWCVTGGSAQLKYSTAFIASLNSQGFQKLPSGLILQWGLATTDASGAGTITYPIAFPNAVLHKSGSYIGSGPANGYVVSFGPSGSLTNCQVYFALNGAGIATVAGISWAALGY